MARKEAIVMIYECVDCQQNYCARCDGGEDSCKECRTGPFCPDCAYDHTKVHEDEEDNADVA